GVHAAVHFEVGGGAQGVQLVTDFLDLGDHLRHERLTGIAGVDAHDQDQVCERQGGIQGGGGGGGVERDARFASQRLDFLHHCGQVCAGFDMHGDVVRTCF